ncbi:hypothetical protein ACH42_14405 [Endozoicomonas sp. (ex Bugula neritina AB1)]|nr:hypothetical protein ACH42_14405 [Endozoicomonas sp. (ex Bugula neritina AB1)]
MSQKDDEEKLFREAVGDVKPLISKPRHNQQRSASAELPKSTLRARRSAAESGKATGSAALSEAWIEPIDPEQRIEYFRPGLQQTRMRQLRQGQLNVQYQVDLHGYRIEEARELIYEFIQFARDQNYTCVRVVHGKSHRSADRQTTLKSHVNHWLKQIPEVLAFCSATPSEGGTGSVLVLLKRK